MKSYLIKFWTVANMNGREFTATRIESFTGDEPGIQKFILNFIALSDEEVKAYQVFVAQSNPVQP